MSVHRLRSARNWVIARLMIGLVGLGMEVVFTAISRQISEPQPYVRLLGYSSVFYVVIYALAPEVIAFMRRLRPSAAFYTRAIVYMFAILVIELVWMLTLRAIFGQSPSEEDYRRARYTILDATRPLLGPFWAVAGLILEQAWKIIHAGVTHWSIEVDTSSRRSPRSPTDG